ncbi:maltodextrin-binding protein MdxE [Thermoclostridium stercorarium subsp. leptospartum DSM 9219]|jgi:arabinogalactan oligomer/maltooligosaccharide transport system substrate-binding protein|uniref:Maltodextrin-binding protein n=1 Tax=Thermoclostridium stercorarium subsp. leptospartum DSM 9219 TaxID=1346611 RepID=A0A1B1YJH7_THEST|nr:maltose ABC transporter substrate-binding protein [Thermoclostridium stercorarium]ANX00911.1 maltodextrin-binding protein MdxE [Thermoclostridium stercorarium subsp. leptospartum DSM 9219]
MYVKKISGLKRILVMMLVLSVALLGTACSNTSNKQKQTAVQETKNEQNTPAATNESNNTDTGELVPEPGAKLRLWDSDDEGVKEWALEMIEKFQEKYGIEVTFDTVSHTDAPGKLQTDGPAKLAADVFILASDHLGEMYQQGFIYPNDVSDKSEFFESAVEACSIDGQLYGFPAAIETPALIYNKSFVKEPPKTFDELIEISRQFLDKKNNKYGFMMEVWNFYYVYAFMSGYGGYVFGNNGTDPYDIGLNSEASIKALEFYRTLKEIIPLQREDISYDIKSGLFIEGKLLFDFNGPWAIKAYKDAGIDVGVAPLPLLPNGQRPITFSGVRTYCVNTYTDYPNAAKLLAQFLTSKEALLRRYELTNQLPTRNDLLSEPEIKENPVNSGFLEQAVHSQPMPSIPHMQAVWSNMEIALTEIWNNPDADIKTELDRAVNNIMETDFYKNN